MFLNRHLLLAVTADFVDCIEKKHMKTFFTFWIVKDYNKKEQFVVLFSVLQDYDIVQKLEAVVVDNSDTNNTLCWKIETHFLQVKNIVWNPEH